MKIVKWLRDKFIRDTVSQILSQSAEVSRKYDKHISAYFFLGLGPDADRRLLIMPIAPCIITTHTTIHCRSRTNFRLYHSKLEQLTTPRSILCHRLNNTAWSKKVRLADSFAFVFETPYCVLGY